MAINDFTNVMGVSRTTAISNADGSPSVIALDRRGNQKVSSPIRNSAIDGSLWIGANPSGTPVTTQAGVSATTPALTLYNPTGSGVNAVIQQVTVGITTAPAANTQLLLAYNLTSAAAPTATTGANVTSGKVGASAAGSVSSNGVAVYRIATLATAPVACRYIGGVLAASSTGTGQIIDYTDGSVVVPPGGCVSIQATTAVAIVGAIAWEEVPV